jgi:predicted glycosyltransferase
LITLRDFSQTRGLAEQHGLDFITVGHHCQSSSRLRKVTSTLHRAWELRRLLARERVAAAVSHGSRASLLAAKSLGVPALTLDDYEFSSIGLYKRFSNRILIPSIIPEDRLLAQGLPLHKVVRYPGIKEEVYVYDVTPDATVLNKLGLDPRRVIVTLRPPATWAHYHDGLGERLFRALLQRLDRTRDMQVVVSARTDAQRQEIRLRYGLSPDKFIFPLEAVDALSLMWFSDAVFSGGGTMVREAALLGVPTYSVFGGRVGAADEYLVSRGRLRLLRDPAEIANIPLPEQRTARPAAPTGKSLAGFIANEILRFITEPRNRVLASGLSSSAHDAH